MRDASGDAPLRQPTFLHWPPPPSIIISALSLYCHAIIMRRQAL